MQQQTTRLDQHQRKEKTTMKATTSHRIPKGIACIAAAIAVATPGLASAEFGDRARARIQTITTNGGVILSNVREAAQERIGDDQPLANAIGGARGSAAEVFETVRQMHVLEQLRETAAMMKQMQAGYKRFSGGGGCGGACASFRSSLKNVVHNFVELALEVPALRSARGLTENLQRTANLIDHVPPRVLYLMWHATSDNVAELEQKTNEIRQILASLPPLMPASGFGASAASTLADSRFCEWANQDKKPVFELVQGELERLGWLIESIADLIPDVAVKGEAGATAGAAVANALASGGVSVKPTDGPKMLLKGIALIPQHLSWAIKLNILRAKVICKNR
jgi:hypothetical protein